MPHPTGIYIHVPFCRQRCNFCAFYLQLHRGQAATGFLRALTTELRLYASQEEIADRTFQSVYVGGGTPTALATKQLTSLIGNVRLLLRLTSDCEITVEAHPATVTQSDLEMLLAAGVNRISFGAESMHNDELIRVGRPGTTDETIAAVHAAREAGFSNVNLDLMYGLPDQSIERWQDTLARCLAMNPSHLSCYALTVEEGTRLAHDVRLGKTTAPDESLQVDMFLAAQTTLTAGGYEHYEISNYAKPGCASRHNELYWTNGDYLGLGPSAQSFVDGVRFGNVADLAAYQAALAQGRLPIADRTLLSREERIRDAVIFGLRLLRGVPTALMREHAANFGYTNQLESLRARQLVEEDGNRTRLSAQGRLHADTIAEQLY